MNSEHTGAKKLTTEQYDVLGLSQNEEPLTQPIEPEVDSLELLLGLAQGWTEFCHFIGNTPRAALIKIYLDGGAPAFQAAASELKAILKGKRDEDGRKLGALGDFDRWVKAVEREAKNEGKLRDADRAQEQRAERQRKWEQSNVYPDIEYDGWGNPRILPTFRNFEAMCQKLCLDLRMDVIRRVLYVPEDIRAAHSINERARAQTVDIQDHCTREKIKVPVAQLRDWIKVQADKYRVNPVREWLEKNAQEHPICPEERGRAVAELFSCLELAEDVTDQERAAYVEYLGKWLVQCVSMAHNENGDGGADFVLTLQSLSQGIGKGRFFNHLCNVPELKPYYREGKQLNPNHKDDVLETTSCWICELGEVETTTSRKAVGALKAFITKASDNVRAPYDASYSDYPRFTSYCATVNEPDFLLESGRRFVVIPIVGVDLPKLYRQDIALIWAEAYSAYVENPNGFRLDRNDVMETTRLSDRFRKRSNEEQTILDSYDWEEAPEKWRELTATDIARELNLKRPVAVGKAMRPLGYEETTDTRVLRRFRATNAGKKYHIPPLTYEAQSAMSAREKRLDSA